MTKKTSIADALDIIPIQQQGEIVPVVEDQTKVDDEIIDTSIDNLKEIVEKAKEALGEITIIATSTEEPKAFTALASIISVTVAANKELERAARDRRKEKQATAQQAGDTNLTNNGNVFNFYGTTDDLARHVKEIELKKNED